MQEIKKLQELDLENLNYLGVFPDPEQKDRCNLVAVAGEQKVILGKGSLERTIQQFRNCAEILTDEKYCNYLDMPSKHSVVLLVNLEKVDDVEYVQTREGKYGTRFIFNNEAKRLLFVENNPIMGKAKFKFYSTPYVEYVGGKERE